MHGHGIGSALRGLLTEEVGTFVAAGICFRQRKPNRGIQMIKEMITHHSSENQVRRSGGAPLVVAIAVAVTGMFSILIFDYGPWNKPKVQPAVTAHYSTTGEAARAAGAKIMPTEPRLQVEPDPAGPKPVNPANPTPR